MKISMIFIGLLWLCLLSVDMKAQVTVTERYDTNERLIERVTVYGGDSSDGARGGRSSGSGNEFTLVNGRLVSLTTPGYVGGHEDHSHDKKSPGWGRQILNTFVVATVNGFGFYVGSNLAGSVLPPRQNFGLNSPRIVTGHSPGDGHGH